MADSAGYQIILALQSALEGITVANGYQTDVKIVDIYEKFADDIPSFPAIMLATVDEDEDQQTFADYNAITMRVLVVLAIETYTQEHKLVGDFIADVKKRLFSEIPVFLGGLSRWVRVGRVTRIHGSEEDPRAGAEMELSIYFRHPIQDPYTLIP